MGQNESISRSKFTKTQVVFDLSSFKLQTTDKKWFQGNRIMRNITRAAARYGLVKGRSHGSTPFLLPVQADVLQFLQDE